MTVQFHGSAPLRRERRVCRKSNCSLTLTFPSSICPPAHCLVLSKRRAKKPGGEEWNRSSRRRAVLMCILEEEETAAREVAAAAYTTHPNWTWAKPQEKRGKQRRKNIHEVLSPTPCSKLLVVPTSSKTYVKHFFKRYPILHWRFCLWQTLKKMNNRFITVLKG